MNLHNLHDALNRAQLKSSGSLLYVPGYGRMLAYGTTVPTDATTGYAPGCLFIHIDGAAGTALYTNEGTSTSCDFNPVDVGGAVVGSLVLGDNEYVKFGDANDATMAWDGTQLEILPKTDDTGALNVGDGTTDMDVKIFLSTTGKYVLFDVGNVKVVLEDVDLRLGDNDILEFGDAADVTAVWDASKLQVSPAADDTGLIAIGDGTKDLDLKVYLSAATKYVSFDVGDAKLYLEDVDLRLGDNDIIELGDGTDFTLRWNGTYLDGTAATMWGNAPSPAMPDYHVYAEEYFNDFQVAKDFDATNEWTVTEDDAADTQALSGDAVDSCLILTQKAVTDNDGAQVELNNEIFLLATGKKLWFEARVKTAAGATEVDFYVGLFVSEDLTGVADNMAGNGILFHKDEDATVLALASSDDGTNLQNASVKADWDTSFHRIGFYFDGGATGAATITPYIDGVAGTPIASVTYAVMSELCPVFGLRNGDGVTTQTLYIDWVRVVQLR